MTTRRCVVFVLTMLAFLVGHAAFAQPYDYHVYIDSDLRASTGCSVSAGGQTFEGADYRLTATVSGNPPVVTARTLTPCSSGSFGTGAALGANYPVGLNNGVAGGPPMVVGSPALIPTLGFFGGLLLAIGLDVVALRTLKLS